MQEFPTPPHPQAQHALKLVRQALLGSGRLNPHHATVFGCAASYCDHEMRRYNLRRAPQGHTILHWGFASDCSDDRQPGGGYVYACLHQGEECVAVVRPCGRQLGNSSWRLETLACDSDTPLLRDLHLTNLDLPNLTDEQAFELMQRFEAHFSGLMELQNVVSLAAP